MWHRGKTCVQATTVGRHCVQNQNYLFQVAVWCMTCLYRPNSMQQWITNIETPPQMFLGSFDNSDIGFLPRDSHSHQCAVLLVAIKGVWTQLGMSLILSWIREVFCIQSHSLTASSNLAVVQWQLPLDVHNCFVSGTKGRITGLGENLTSTTSFWDI